MHGWVFCIEDNIRYDVNKNDLIVRRPREHRTKNTKTENFWLFFVTFKQILNLSRNTDGFSVLKIT